MSDYPGRSASSPSETLPATQSSEQATVSTTSSDEAIARQLHEELNGRRYVIAQPVVQAPFNCGSCQTLHSVQNPRAGCQFTCTECGAINLIHPPRHVILARDTSPVFCTIS
ncbi:hypothetical protein SPRG_18226 [Saprolegnia parasitica CBS 223.65]|uniref:Uncharacterized protein n=1 Tax=Saprolegnia parasitica (strain CBS 223.65) TaxID=695850 RepID=A0A067BD23_SAPPC|nr:hypothetical protein SPRG_18226 [Saprolegnia parasitica CBS 223.65]KDO16239.1 hypothetical protein SPRG_18226 [Saprolegnia parasitica CBS 223.65]|eukprot:XP_012213053.1 hypothetical protein SPRG_18226 [Saprolegnia parasitica CBS 223.65]